MLTQGEKKRIMDLAAGRVQPEPGLEKHFILVVNGQGIPCSPIEKAWFSFYKEAHQFDEGGNDVSGKPRPEPVKSQKSIHKAKVKNTKNDNLKNHRDEIHAELLQIEKDFLTTITKSLDRTRTRFREIENLQKTNSSLFPDDITFWEMYDIRRWIEDGTYWTGSDTHNNLQDERGEIHAELLQIKKNIKTNIAEGLDQMRTKFREIENLQKTKSSLFSANILSEMDIIRRKIEDGTYWIEGGTNNIEKTVRVNEKKKRLPTKNKSSRKTSIDEKVRVSEKGKSRPPTKNENSRKTSNVKANRKASQETAPGQGWRKCEDCKRVIDGNNIKGFKSESTVCTECARKSAGAFNSEETGRRLPEGGFGTREDYLKIRKRRS